MKSGASETQLKLKHRLEVARGIVKDENSDDAFAVGDASFIDCRVWMKNEYTKVSNKYKQKSAVVASLTATVSALGESHAEIIMQGAVELLKQRHAVSKRMDDIQGEATHWTTLSFQPRFKMAVEYLDQAFTAGLVFLFLKIKVCLALKNNAPLLFRLPTRG